MNTVRWVTPTGCNSATGGGVAKAVSILKEEDVVSSSDYLSVHRKPIWIQIYLAIKDVFILNYRQFIIHSFFTPYTFTILMLPFRGKIMLLPHGELKSGALKISKRVKSVYIRIMKISSHYIGFLKTLSLICSNHEELLLAKNILHVKRHLIVEDIISTHLPMKNEQKLDPNMGLNFIIISRLVPNKGVADFLTSLLGRLKRAELKKSTQFTYLCNLKI